MGWWFRYTGAGDLSGAWYGFWSGFGSIIIPPLLTAVPIVLTLLRRHNCHQPGCWRIGRLPVEGTAFLTCRRHHPSPPERETIRERHHLYTGRRPGRG